MTDPKIAAMVDAMLARNENFRGTSVDEGKLALFTDIRQKADALARLMHGVLTVRPPENTARNALVMIDVPLPVSIFSESVRARLAELIRNADDVSFASPSGSVMRISLGIHGVWQD